MRCRGTYSIEGGNAAAQFEIDAASGELFYTGGGEDYETGSTSFELTVRASDGDQTTDTAVTVNVTDVDEPVVVDPPVTPPDQSTPQTVSEPAGEDFSTDPSTSGRVAVGDTATGRIGSNGDRDWFAVELVAGRTYVIDLRGSRTDDGTLSDPYLRGIYDSDGNLIPRTTNDDGGQGYNSRLTFTATESGTHYIAAGAYSGQGTYEVEVTDTSPPIVGPDPDSEDPPDRQEQVQQQPPAFGSQFYAFDLAENADGSADRISLGTVSATDPEGATLVYSLVSGNGSGQFEIDAASGELFYTGGGEDHETGSTSFELTVRASDGDQTTDTTVTVIVTDVAEAPAFGQAGYAFDLAEETLRPRAGRRRHRHITFGHTAPAWAFPTRTAPPAARLALHSPHACAPSDDDAELRLPPARRAPTRWEPPTSACPPPAPRTLPTPPSPDAAAPVS